MRQLILAAASLGLIGLSACASTDGGGYASNSRYDRGNRYMSACERDYQNNRNAATVGGAVVGGVAGAAIAKDDAAGAAIGAIAGGVIGRSLASKDDPCGYGFTGYYRGEDNRYGHWDDRRGRWVYG